MSNLKRAHHTFTNKMVYKLDHKPKNRSSKNMRILLSGQKSVWSKMSGAALLQLTTVGRSKFNPEIQHEIARRGLLTK